MFVKYFWKHSGQDSEKWIKENFAINNPNYHNINNRTKMKVLFIDNNITQTPY
jgi:hypothetical protein